MRLGLDLSRRPFILAMSTMLVCNACGGAGGFHPSTPADVNAAGNPLGPSYILVPLPNDDDALLGRVLLDLPEQGRSLDEVSRPNECADKLTPKKEGPLASTFEDGQELAVGGKASAALGAFGFEGDASRATHFYYKLDVSKRSSQTDTTDYVACCKEKGSCGYGFISALIYGDGTYATAEEDNVSGTLKIPVAGGAGGYVNAKILHKRNVHGYVAALVTVTDQNQSKKTNVLGDPAAAGIVLTEQNLPEQVKARFEAQKIQIIPDATATQLEVAYDFKDGNGLVSERNFVDRYASLTGSHELDGAPPASGTFYWILGASLMGTGAIVGLGELLAHAPPSTCNQCGGDQSAPPYSGLDTAVTVGAVVAIAGGIPLFVGGLVQNGHHHNITKFDAELYVAKYNRALLKKTIDETKDRMRELSGSLYPASRTTSFELQPVVSPGFTGIMARF